MLVDVGVVIRYGLNYTGIGVQFSAG